MHARLGVARSEEDSMSIAVYGFATTVSRGRDVVDELRQAGFAAEDVSMLFPRDAYAEGLGYEKGSKAPEGMAAGGTTGGFLGGSLGWLVGVGALAIPGLGPFIAAGPVLAALSGAAVGAAVGGLTGGLIGLGIPEYEAKDVEGKIRDGEILIAVRTATPAERERATAILSHGAGAVAYAADGRIADVN
jgi:hypothetical protein